MGYETTMIVVTRHSNSLPSLITLLDNKLFSCFKDPNEPHYYYPDNNTKTPVPPNTTIKTGSWCNQIAIIDLCKAGSFPGICDFKDSDGCYTYDPFDGNKLLGLDGYGSYRSFVHIQKVINIFNSHIKNTKAKGEEPYHRFVSALAFLRSAKKTFQGYSGCDLGCLFYGH